MSRDDVLFGYRLCVLGYAARTSVSEASSVFEIHPPTFDDVGKRRVWAQARGPMLLRGQTFWSRYAAPFSVLLRRRPSAHERQHRMPRARSRDDVADGVGDRKLDSEPSSEIAQYGCRR